MTRTLLSRAVFVASALLLLGTSCRAQDLAITNTAVYAAPDATVQKNVTILIRHGVIVGVGANLRTPKDIQTISCAGCTVLAGFWNAHVHFMEPKWNNAANQPAEKFDRTDERDAHAFGLHDSRGYRFRRRE